MRVNGYTILMYAVAFLYLSSCSDDLQSDEEVVLTNQDYVEILSAGEWTLTSQTFNGEEIDNGVTTSDHTQIYDPCPLTEGPCNGRNSFKTQNQSTGETIERSTSFIYSISEDLTVLAITLVSATTTTTTSHTTFCTQNCKTVYRILEWSDSKHVLRTINLSGDTIIQILERK